jgi:hypothetical protein
METLTPFKWLRCNVCGMGIKYSPKELLQFTDTGWPNCCGEVMILAESTEETPALSPDGSFPTPRN